MQESRFIPGTPVRLTTATVPVYRLLCPNAGMMTGPGTNTYLIGDRAFALIDPGPALPGHTQAIVDFLAGRPLHRIFVTHTHGDHSPGTVALRQATGAEVIGMQPPPDAAYQDRSFVPDHPGQNFAQIVCDGFTIQLIHTPGHVSNHLCFLLEEEGMLFTGDHILQGTTPVILPPDGNMTDYLESLQQLLELPLRTLAPGHGEVMDEPQQMITTLIRHRLRREQKIVSSLGRLGMATLDELVVPVYDDVPQHLLPWAKKTMLAHLYKLRQDGRAALAQEDSDDVESQTWQLVAGS